MKRKILIAATTAVLAATSITNALPAISPEVKPKAEAVVSKLYGKMLKDGNEAKLRKLNSSLNSLVGNSNMYAPLDPYKE